MSGEKLHGDDRVDMSSAAIDRRLRDVGELYRLGNELRGIRHVGKLDHEGQSQKAKDPLAPES
jgi:hypothetical protein